MKRALLLLFCALILTASHPADLCAQSAAAQGSGKGAGSTAPRQKPMAAAPKQGKASATASRAKARPFAKQAEDSPINLRFGREEVVDPLTKQSVAGKADPAAVTDNIKKMDLKGALDKVGGKAEVQVDILKF